MNRTISERKVLKMLGISDFRHMTKDKVVQFASMLPKMDPEVAKKALDQFPEFAAAAREIVSYFKATVDKELDANSASVHSFYKTCDTIIETLERQLMDGSLSFEEKSILIDKMISLAEMKSAKDTEEKRHHQNILAMIISFFIGIIMALGVLLGIRSEAYARREC